MRSCICVFIYTSGLPPSKGISHLNDDDDDDSCLQQNR